MTNFFHSVAKILWIVQCLVFSWILFGYLDHMDRLVVRFMLISKLISNLIADFISDFGIASMENHNISFNLVTWFNMEVNPKFDIKYVTKSVIRFDNSRKPTTWIGH